MFTCSSGHHTDVHQRTQMEFLTEEEQWKDCLPWTPGNITAHVTIMLPADCSQPVLTMNSEECQALLKMKNSSSECSVMDLWVCGFSCCCWFACLVLVSVSPPPVSFEVKLTKLIYTIYLKSIMWWFNICAHYEMTSTMKLINTLGTLVMLSYLVY